MLDNSKIPNTRRTRHTSGAGGKMRIRSMMNTGVCLIVLALSLLPGAGLAFAQVTGAQIDETKVQVQLYVDQSNPAASDKNSGISSSPFTTISAAVAHASQKSGGT